MKINIHFGKSGRPVGFSKRQIARQPGYDQTVTTTKQHLADLFQSADADTLAGTRDNPDGEDDPIEAAIEEPLRFRDFLILEDGEIAFDEEYVREGDEEDEP